MQSRKGKGSVMEELRLPFDRDEALDHIKMARDFLEMAQFMLMATADALAAWADEIPLSPEIDKLLDLEGECRPDSFENVIVGARAEMETLLDLIPTGGRVGSGDEQWGSER